MKKVVLAVLALGLVLPWAPTVAAQTQAGEYKMEVCVNASDVEQAKRLFPKAILHVIPNFTDSRMNGWRIVAGQVRAHGKIMTDAEEIALRKRESFREMDQDGE